MRRQSADSQGPTGAHREPESVRIQHMPSLKAQEKPKMFRQAQRLPKE